MTENGIIYARSAGRCDKIFTKVFRRIEQKFLCTDEQKSNIIDIISDKIEPDEFGKSTLTSIYFDTPVYTIARESESTDNYKEKIRLRTYGKPGKDSPVFLELKKKLSGVVYKRRETLTLAEAEEYIKSRTKPRQSQIFRELDYAFDYYNNPEPKIAICCEREAFFVKENHELRLTFDSGIRYRADDLRLDFDPVGKKIIPDGLNIMEFKTAGVCPLWMARALDQLTIRKTSFSKYCRAYNDRRLNDNNFIDYKEFIS